MVRGLQEAWCGEWEKEKERFFSAAMSGSDKYW